MDKSDTLIGIHPAIMPLDVFFKMLSNMRSKIFFCHLFLIISCSEGVDKSDAKLEKTNLSNSSYDLNYSITNKFPHDTGSFIEGLVFKDGNLFESTGSPDELPHTRSVIGIVDLNTGKINVKIEIDKSKFFGEGITIFKNKIYQLTYKNNISFVYDLRSFQKVNQFRFESIEGWGITTDNISLIMSDGTSFLSFISPDNFKLIRKIRVTDVGNPVININELEFINGFIYANIFMTNFIVKIDPTSGEVIGKLNLNSLAQEAKLLNPNSLEMNGIAFDPLTNSVFVTGKFWPLFFKLKL